MRARIATVQTCRHCESPDTIQTDHALGWETWYCYECCRGFEVEVIGERHGASPDRHRRAPERR